MRRPLATVGIVNCNRAHYARALLRSLVETLDDTALVQLVYVDNASVERSSVELLSEVDALRSSGVMWDVEIVRRQSRDPANEFAAGLNEIVERSAGEIVIPLQGDSQFVRRGWLSELSVACSDSSVGCVVLDAQRRSTISASDRVSYGEVVWREPKRPGVAGAGDVAYPRRVALAAYPWSTRNERHEGSGDSETDMLKRCGSHPTLSSLAAVSLKRPAMVAICTDPRGTNARVRGDRLYGRYAPPRDASGLYYAIRDGAQFSSDAIEDVAVPLGWTAPLDEQGAWKKAPIRPETARAGDWIEVKDLA